MAVHEAGHVVAARALRRGVRSVSIEEDRETLGRVIHYPLPTLARDIVVDGRVRWRIEQSIMILMAGVEAEHRVSDDADRVEAGGKDDFSVSAGLAMYVTGGEPEETSAYIRWLTLRVRNIILANEVWWSAVESLARELLKRPTLSGKEANAAIQVGIDEVIVPDVAEFLARTRHPAN
jgi:hypothetical protein